MRYKTNFPKPDGRPVIVPSVLSADFSCLKKSLKGLSGAAWIQVDVMDGHFVPNLSFGPHITAGVVSATTLPVDAHLMVEKPSIFIEPFAKAGASLITVHAEAGAAGQCLKKIKAMGLKAGLAVKPGTRLQKAAEYLGSIDLLLLMTVEPGFGGQAFIRGVLPKISAARELIARSGRPIWLQVDGGINAVTAVEAVNAGADSLVMGSALFSRRDPARFIKSLKNNLPGV